MSRVGSLCTGYGGLDMAVGGTLAWVSDTDRGAATLLAHRHPDTPNLGDLTAVDWDRVEPVDVVTAGWPCQPWSQAGQRKGADDERAIWPGIARAVRMVRPRHVVLENVAAIVGMGELGRAVGDLAALGYVGSWACVRASDVGAPHRRERCFIAARDTSRGWHGERAVCRGVRRGQPEAPPRGGRCASPDPTSDGRDERRTEPAQRTRDGGQPASDHGPATDTDNTGRAFRRGEHGTPIRKRLHHSSATAWGSYEQAIRRWERVLGRPAPAPLDDGRLSPRFVEFLMGCPEGWVTDVPGLSRTAQLKLLGNGVVPQQAAYALRLLGTNQRKESSNNFTLTMKPERKLA